MFWALTNTILNSPERGTAQAEIAPLCCAVPAILSSDLSLLLVNLLAPKQGRHVIAELECRVRRPSSLRYFVGMKLAVGRERQS